MTDRRAQRVAFLGEGHICSNWWQCELCAARLAEMEAKYPKEQDGEAAWRDTHDRRGSR